MLCNSFEWEDVDAKIRSYLFLCLGSEEQRQVQLKKPGLDLQAEAMKELMTVLEVFLFTQKIALESINFIFRKQKTNSSQKKQGRGLRKRQILHVEHKMQGVSKTRKLYYNNSVISAVDNMARINGNHVLQL